MELCDSIRSWSTRDGNPIRGNVGQAQSGSCKKELSALPSRKTLAREQVQEIIDFNFDPAQGVLKIGSDLTQGVVFQPSSSKNIETTRGAKLQPISRR